MPIDTKWYNYNNIYARELQRLLPEKRRTYKMDSKSYTRKKANINQLSNRFKKLFKKKMKPLTITLKTADWKDISSDCGS